MNILERIGLRAKTQRSQGEVPPFSQEDMRQKLLTTAGNRFFNDLDHHSQARISEVFASQNEELLKDLINTYDAPTVEAISLALDDAVKGVIGVETSYHSWTTGIMHGQGEQSQK